MRVPTGIVSWFIGTPIPIDLDQTNIGFDQPACQQTTLAERGLSVAMASLVVFEGQIEGATRYCRRQHPVGFPLLFSIRSESVRIDPMINGLNKLLP